MAMRSSALRSRGRLVALILYLRTQEESYLDYCDNIRILYEWLKQPNEVAEFRPIADPLPDICGCCLGEFAYTHAGRVRNRCWWCDIRQKPYLVRYWPSILCTILRTSESVLESYLAQALSIVRGENPYYANCNQLHGKNSGPH